MAKKRRKERLGQSVTFVSKIIVFPLEDHNGRPCRNILLKCSDGQMDREFQLSGFGKDIPVEIRKNFRGC